jgi:DNA gyrase subunit B
VYIAQPPLYQVKRGKEIRYTYTEREQDKLLAEIAAAAPGAKLDIKRYKGLGEMDAEQLWNTTMAYENRTLIQVMIDDEPAADETFSMLMGDKVPPRRRFIEDNARAVKNLDI